MEVQALTTKEVIANTLEEAKKVIKSDNYSVYSAFEYAARAFYYFAERHIKNTTYNCTLKEWVEIFTRAVMDSQEIPGVYCIIISYYYIHCIEERRKVPSDTELLEQLKAQIKERRELIAELDSVTSAIRKILNHQTLSLYWEYAMPLIKWRRLNESPIDYIMMDIFNYGYIIGKREERAKKRKSKSVA